MNWSAISAISVSPEFWTLPLMMMSFSLAIVSEAP